jgi:hypothetical protein
MRIINEVILDTKDPAALLASDRQAILSRIKAMCGEQYTITHNQLNARIGKTILFILITKTLIGVSIEIPYDLQLLGQSNGCSLPSTIFFPLLYMVTISLNITTPSRQNTEAIASFADRILYDGAGAPVVYKPKRRVKSKSLRGAFTFVYAVGFIGSISLLVWAPAPAGL